MKDLPKFSAFIIFIAFLIFLFSTHTEANTKPLSILKPVIIGSKDYHKFIPVFNKLNHNLKINPGFITGLSKKEYFEKFEINYIPYIFIDKRDLSDDIKNLIRAKTNWKEYKEVFVVSKEDILEVSSLYFLNREKKVNNIDIIVSGKDIEEYKNNKFINELLDSGYKVNFHKQGILFSSDLHKELDVDKTPLILYQNQYLVYDLKSLIEIREFKKFKYNIRDIELDKKIVIDFFGAPFCKFCNDVKKEILPDIEKKYEGMVDVVYFNVAEKENYEFLLKMKDFFNVKEGGIPKIFIGDTVLTGRNDIARNLKNEIFNALILRQYLFDIKHKIKIEYYFDSSDLEDYEDREEIFYKFLPQILERYKKQIEIKGYDIKAEKNWDKLSKKLKESNSIKDIKMPVIFINGQLLQGAERVKYNLDRLIQEKMIVLLKGKAPDEDIVLSRFRSFTLPTVIIAGLLDGVNPCAFTVIVFFISFLAVAGYGKKEMFYIGISFIFAVFLAYFLIGTGLFSIFYKLSVYKMVADIFDKVIISIVFILAGFNLYDYMIYKRSKDSKNIVLQLPYKIKILIHKVIGMGYRNKNGRGKRQSIFRLIFIAFIVGFAVSILESVCTGQVYFPTVAYLTQLPNIMKMKAFIYLFVYNFMFVVPLFFILALGLVGVTSEDFSKFVKLHLGKIKLLTAILFFFLGYILIIFY